MNELSITELGKLFKIFSNKYRLQIIVFLKNKKEASVGEIADNLTASFQAVSKHLAVLEKAGILTSRYDGSFVMYKILDNLPDVINKLLNFVV